MGRCFPDADLAGTDAIARRGCGRCLRGIPDADDQAAAGRVHEQEPGIIGQPDSPATPATRRTAISKMRKHELVEELNERGMETGGVVKELRDRLRAAREAGA